MKPYYIGIDPGKKGALGVVGDGISMVSDCPATAAEAAGIVREIVEAHGPCNLAALEKVHSMPKQGVKSTFSFGENFGMWQGILAAFSIPMICPTPQQWMKKMHIPPRSDKAVHVQIASQHFPFSVMFTGPKGGLKDGRADAMLLAEYAKLWTGK